MLTGNSVLFLLRFVIVHLNQLFAVYSNSDIWRDFPSWFSPIFRALFLTSAEGSSTSVAAAVHNEFGTTVGSTRNHTPLYLQPYAYNGGNHGAVSSQSPMVPWRELSGPYVGFSATPPRLSIDGGVAASQALWDTAISACEIPVVSLS